MTNANKEFTHTFLTIILGNKVVKEKKGEEKKVEIKKNDKMFFAFVKEAKIFLGIQNRGFVFY